MQDDVVVPSYGVEGRFCRDIEQNQGQGQSGMGECRYFTMTCTRTAFIRMHASQNRYRLISQRCLGERAGLIEVTEARWRQLTRSRQSIARTMSTDSSRAKWTWRSSAASAALGRRYHSAHAAHHGRRTCGPGERRWSGGLAAGMAEGPPYAYDWGSGFCVFNDLALCTALLCSSMALSAFSSLTSTCIRAMAQHRFWPITQTFTLSVHCAKTFLPKDGERLRSGRAGRRGCGLPGSG